MTFTEDQDPIETVIGWLTHVASNDGILSRFDIEHILTEVVPQATQFHKELLEKSKCDT